MFQMFECFKARGVTVHFFGACASSQSRFLCLNETRGNKCYSSDLIIKHNLLATLGSDWPLWGTPGWKSLVLEGAAGFSVLDWLVSLSITQAFGILRVVTFIKQVKKTVIWFFLGVLQVSQTGGWCFSIFEKSWEIFESLVQSKEQASRFQSTKGVWLSVFTRFSPGRGAFHNFLIESQERICIF